MKKRSETYWGVNKQMAKTVFENKLEDMSMLTSYKPDEKKLLEYLKLYGYDYNSILSNLNIYRLDITDYLQIDFKSENPELSAFVVNTVFQQFIRYYNTMQNQKSSESIDTLRNLVQRKKDILDAKNALLQSRGIVNGEIQAKSSFDLIKELQTKLADAKDKQNILTYSIQKYKDRITAASTSAGQSNVSPIDISNNDEVVALRKQKDDAYKDYLNSGSTDQAALAKYTQLKNQYLNKIKTLTAATTPVTKPSATENISDLLQKQNDAETDLEATKATISSLETQISVLNGNAITEASQNASTESLKKEVELANQEYIDAKKNYNDATDVTHSSVNNFKQVLLGQPAIDPEPSKRLMIVAGAGMGAFAVTILIIIFLAYLDTSIKTPAIFQKAVNLKMLSMVNQVNLKNKSLSDMVTDKNFTTDDWADKNRRNVFRESLRKLRYEIEKSGKKVFLFTSAKKGEGKTTLIQALSYSMSLSKKKILIIDTNFSNNDLTVQLHGESVLDKISPGKNGELLDEVKKKATDVGAGSVFVIGCESGDYTPSEFLPRENLLQHLRSLTKEYDYVFLEGPPLNDFSDSRELAEFVDGVIGVFFCKKRNIKH